jgi:Predicted membrane protein
MAATGKDGYGPLPIRVRPVARLINLYVGLCAYGLSMALMVESHLGNMPWDVFHQGIARVTGLSFGTVVIIVGVIVLLLWIPLRQRPGLGTVSNVIVIGLATDAALFVLPTPSAVWTRGLFLAAGILLNAVATGLYVGARLGPGPRDGLMTGLAARGYSIRLVRTGIEVSVVLVGFLLGGTLGVGTIIYALAIGPLVHITLPLLTVRVAPPALGTNPATANP